ncbi:MAG: hypothetical protein QY323_05020 [Patescibacteria group bacterium]|nr:MAG: hypothetical protein QY323_05020 [Patescibacteria group bacterium]
MDEQEYEAFELEIGWRSAPPRPISPAEKRMRQTDAPFEDCAERRERRALEQRALLEDRVRIFCETALESCGCDAITYRHDDRLVFFSWPGDPRTVHLPLAQFLQFFGHPASPLLRVIK